MDAIQMLKQEHEQAKKMFGEIEQASGERRGQLWTKLRPELKVHEQLEEAALYGPVAREVGANDSKLSEWEEHHHEEVSELESMIQNIDELEPSEPQWMEKVKELQQTLEHHIEEEEGDIWPRIQQVWDRAKLAQAGDQMATMKPQKMQQAA
jgi:hemerythrin-like domain-containing protein